jgi:hypothetical protein
MSCPLPGVALCRLGNSTRPALACTAGALPSSHDSHEQRLPYLNLRPTLTERRELFASLSASQLITVPRDVVLLWLRESAITLVSPDARTQQQPGLRKYDQGSLFLVRTPLPIHISSSYSPSTSLVLLLEKVPMPNTGKPSQDCHLCRSRRVKVSIPSVPLASSAPCSHM